MNVIFLSTLKNNRYDEGKVEKITLNLVGFNGEPSVVYGKVVMLISTRGKTVYSTMMAVDIVSAYNTIHR